MGASFEGKIAPVVKGLSGMDRGDMDRDVTDDVREGVEK